MESEDLTEEVEREAQRIVAAFGMGEWGLHAVSDSVRVFGAYTENRVLEWCLDELQICEIAVGDSFDLTSIGIPPSPNLPIFESGCYDDLMARGLYRLGFENEAILSQLPPLSAHEKLELRLSLPREFWPQRWLNEDAEQAARV